MITTYLEAKEYLEELIKPIPYKAPEERASSYDPLNRMRTLLKLLGNPEKKFKSVQVSGTSGKGSTAYLLSHMLTHAGYKTGFTLSPHLMSIFERFQINEHPIKETQFLTLINELVPVVSQMENMEVGGPTYFEALMSLTFLYFARERVDIAVVEVGLEGRYDGTNTLDPLLFLITNISLDHIEFLGDTEEKISIEATAAIKKSQQVVSGITQKTLQEGIAKVCQQKQANLHSYNNDFWSDIRQVTEQGVLFDYHRDGVAMHGLFVSLLGEYQGINASLALEAVFILKQFGFVISEEKIRESLKTAHFPGRFEKIVSLHNGRPSSFILDGAHNPAKMIAFVTSLQKIYPGERYSVLFACKKNKDITQMLKELSPIVETLIVTKYYTTTEAAKNSSMTVSEVLSQVNKIGIFPHVLSSDDIREATARALNYSGGKKRIVVTGSLYLVGEMKHYLNDLEQEQS